MIRTFVIIAIRTEPITVPTMVPTPPIMDVPPTITAAMMFISEPVPIAGWTVAKRAP